MARNRRIRHIEVRQTVHLNAQEVILIDRLMETGLYPGTRGQTARYLIDRQLEQLFGKTGPFQVKRVVPA